MFKKIIFGLIVLSTLALGKLNDYREVFSSGDKEKLEDSIKQFENSTKKKLYVNTLEENEGFEVENQEKIVIINLIKNKDNENSNLKIQLKVSQDLNPEEIASDLNLLLENTEEHIGKNNEFLIITNLIDGMQEIFIISSNNDKENNNLFKLSLLNKILIGILLTFSILFIRILQVKRKKRQHKLKKVGIKVNRLNNQEESPGSTEQKG